MRIYKDFENILKYYQREYNFNNKDINNLRLFFAKIDKYHLIVEFLETPD